MRREKYYGSIKAMQRCSVIIFLLRVNVKVHEHKTKESEYIRIQRKKYMEKS